MNAPAEKLYVDTITAQADQLAIACDDDAAFKCLNDSGYRNDESITPLYTQLRYEALVIQFISELLANVPNPDAIDWKKIRLYSSKNNQSHNMRVVDRKFWVPTRSPARYYGLDS